MRFRVLGPLELDGDDGCAVTLGGTKQRGVLAALLLDAGRPVSPRRLTEAVWDVPPPSAAHAVEVYVSELRKLLVASEAHRSEPRITRNGGGYVLLIDPDEFDLLRFRSLVCHGASEAARGRHAEAADRFSEALGLWRGEPLACIEGTPLAKLMRRELEEERVAATLGYVDAAQALGRLDELVEPLRRLVVAHPLRERLVGKLMLALYRSGRHAEALDVYRRERTDLSEQLGVEPGRELRLLQRQILVHAAELEPPPTTATTSRSRGGRNDRRRSQVT